MVKSKKSSQDKSTNSKIAPDIRKLKPTKKSTSLLAIISIVGILLISGYFYVKNIKLMEQEVSVTELISYVDEGLAKKIIIRENMVFVELDDNKEKFSFIQNNTDFFKLLQDEGVKLGETSVEVGVEPVTRINWVDIISLIFMFLLLGGAFLFIKNMQNSGGKLLDFGQSKAKLIFGKKTNIGFKDVAGMKESKEELIEIVQFLKNPEKFTALGARIPKGVLLIGPPGTGKTLLARAIAGEAGVPFFHTSGSEFEEMLVGAGASRVRDLFLKARKASPCIIFIDEIDAVAKKRGTTLHSGNTEQTLNQILVELDGLEPRTNVIVVGATNRPDVLDPAILRPGRFDRHVVLTLPDASEREEILKLHSLNKKFEKDPNFEKISRGTVGFSGADLENMLNEAAIIAAKNEQKSIKEKDVEEAALKVEYGPERKSKKRTKDDLKMVAYHEAGHALVARFTENSDPVHGVSIISRGMAGGITMLRPETDKENRTRNEMIDQIKTFCGGNVAETIIFKDVSTGAASDIKNASRIARDMVKKYGMSDEMGFVQYGDMDEMQYLGYGYEQRDYSDVTARDIDLEVKSLLNSCWNEAKSILEEKRDLLDDLANLLLEKESIDDIEFKEFIEKRESK